MPGGLTRQTNKPCQAVCQFSQPDLSDQQTMLGGLPVQSACPVRPASQPDSSDQQTMQAVCQTSQPDPSDQQTMQVVCQLI